MRKGHDLHLPPKPCKRCGDMFTPGRSYSLYCPKCVKEIKKENMTRPEAETPIRKISTEPLDPLLREIDDYNKTHEYLTYGQYVNKFDRKEDDDESDTAD